MGIDVPEPENELKPIDNPDDQPGEGRDLLKPNLSKVPATAMPVPVITFWDRAWVTTKHFTYGALLAGVGGLIAGAAWPVALGLAISGGVAEAARKTYKDKNAENGSKWPDILDKALELIVLLVKAWRERKLESKGVKK